MYFVSFINFYNYFRLCFLCRMIFYINSKLKEFVFKESFNEKFTNTLNLFAIFSAWFLFFYIFGGRRGNIIKDQVSVLSLPIDVDDLKTRICADIQRIMQDILILLQYRSCFWRCTVWTFITLLNITFQLLFFNSYEQ